MNRNLLWSLADGRKTTKWKEGRDPWVYQFPSLFPPQFIPEKKKEEKTGRPSLSIEGFPWIPAFPINQLNHTTSLYINPNTSTRQGTSETFVYFLHSTDGGKNSNRHFCAIKKVVHIQVISHYSMKRQ